MAWPIEIWRTIFKQYFYILYWIFIRFAFPLIILTLDGILTSGGEKTFMILIFCLPEALTGGLVMIKLLSTDWPPTDYEQVMLKSLEITARYLVPCYTISLTIIPAWVTYQRLAWHWDILVIIAGAVTKFNIYSSIIWLVQPSEDILLWAQSQVHRQMSQLSPSDLQLQQQLENIRLLQRIHEFGVASEQQ